MLPTNIGGAFSRRCLRGSLTAAFQSTIMTHEPLGFLSGSFKGSQQWWATVDKESFAMVSTFMRLEYLLWNGVHIYTDHRYLAHNFDPEACVSSVV